MIVKYGMPEKLVRHLAGPANGSVCLYCTNLAETTEHVLPAAFGSFRNAPTLPHRLCSNCNHKRLGVLDEQLARCGVEGFFRKYYGIKGRRGHDDVNPFMRGSAGGKRIEATSFDPVAGREVAIEIGSNGQGTQLCAISLIEETTGKTCHIPLHPGMTADQLRTAFNRCTIVAPFRSALSFHPHELEWIERLIHEVWPAVTFQDERTVFSNVIERPLLKFQVTDRYHRAFAKIGFHYFLSQFPQFSGREQMFAAIRQFILEDEVKDESDGRASRFIVERTTPLLAPLVLGLVPPVGWRAHVIGAEVRPDRFIAHVQMFLSCDWSAPIRTIILAKPATPYTHQAAGHLFLYDSNGSTGNEVGEAKSLSVQIV